MGCSFMKEKKEKYSKKSYFIEEAIKTQSQLNPVKLKENSSHQFQGIITQKQDHNHIKSSIVHAALVGIQNRKMEKQKYNSQFIVNLLSEENECYRLKDEYLHQQFGNSSTFSTPLKKQFAKSENKSAKTTKKNPIDTIVNIL